MELSDAHKHILCALAEGLILKGHRTMDGEKLYKLHQMDGSVIEQVDPAVMDDLKEEKLIHSNMKFPAASFLLTEKGLKAAEGLIGRDVSALGADNYEP
jgi:uncharacterized protein YjhX (UPF0386 family)